MPAVLVDSNVLIDIFTQNTVWEEWSSAALRAAADTSRLVINAIVFAEISVGFNRIEDVNSALTFAFEREAVPFEAGFLAGQAFSSYRRRGGPKTSLLPDFIIGAHAAVKGYDILTRDVTRYRSYFPTVSLISPD